MIYKNFVITFNGEIYNFLELKEKLVSKDHKFISDSDTEVILHAYEEWGRECVNHFNGMWAFCIYDKNKKELFLSRDRFGKKPVYYYHDEKKFIFASELKALKNHDLNFKINIKALNYYFYQKYIGSDLTIFNNIYKLLPSENLIFDLKSRKIKKEKYYSLEKEIISSRELSVKERVDNIEEILNDAVLKRLIADVPVGSFLSGGVDSSLISAVIAGTKKDFDTFSIGFKEKSYDEVKYSKIVSDFIKTKHHVRYLAIDEKLIEHIIGSLDEPFGDSSIIPTYLLSKITRERVTVALSGDAGDEVFAGYDTYLAYKITKIFPRVLIKIFKRIINLIPLSDKKLSISFKIKKFINDFDEGSIKRHLDWMSQTNIGQRKVLLRSNYIDDNELFNFRDNDSLLAIQLNDINNYLSEDILKKVDAATMMNSLEARVPFLDYRLVPLVLGLPDKYKIRLFRTKWLLKKIAKKYIPKKIINRKKRGFTVPIYRWLKESRIIKDLILNKKYFGHGFLNYNFVLKLYDDHIKKIEDNSRILWLIFVFNLWFENFLIRAKNENSSFNRQYRSGWCSDFIKRIIRLF